MSYCVLARTYRSNTFDEVVGQETIATTLKNAITSGRVHHGYLFTGTRGVGKTSMARILAKALNCADSDAPTITPCCSCGSCEAIAVGEDIDVVEIDAASNTSVDNIRELRSNATLRPARSRFKIYIIDEVHMLSTNAFNALLKTLEEPPSHVKFILATTESQKVPATIQSRCQLFDFRAIDATAIADHLRRVIEAEGLKAEEGVLRRIGRLANGSMRDALSLLDKLLSYEPTCLTAEVANEVIPPPHDELASALIDCVSQSDVAGALRELDRALQSGRTVERFCDNLIDHVRTLMLLRVCGDDTELVDVADSVRPALVTQAAGFDAPTYVFVITLLEELRRNVKSSGAGRALADAAIVRLAMAQQFTDIGKLIARLEGDTTASVVEKTSGGAKKKESLNPNVAESVGSAGAAAPPGTSASSPAASAPVSQSRAGLEPSVSSTGVSESGLGAGFSGGFGSAPSGLAPDGRRLSSAERARVAEDEFVVRVKEAVDGTLLDVRAAQPPVSPGCEVSVEGELEAGKTVDAPVALTE